MNVWPCVGRIRTNFRDKQEVVKDVWIPEAILSKKHNDIYYHAVYRAATVGIHPVFKEEMKTNLADQ